ncbi:MAG: hypothetical protein Q9199_002791 [Rusavskia elegans]
MVQSSTDDVCPPTQVNSARDDPERMYATIKAAPNMDPCRTSEQTASDAEDMHDVFRIVPLNKEAREAFNGVAHSAKNGSLNPLHTQYLRITGKRSLGYDSEDVRGSGGETTDEDPKSTLVHVGYYRVNLALPSISKGPTWVVGRGSGQRFGPTRNVDIILVAPGTKGVRSLAAAHLYLRIHPHSGAWRITAGAKVRVEDKSYSSGEDVFLRQPRTRIEILDMQYMIRFEISTPSQESEYVNQRNEMLQKEGFTLPRTDISGIPFHGDTVFDSIVFRHGLGSGSFGSVYEGFDPSSGKLRVAKRIILKSAREVPDVDREIRALERFNNHAGIIELVDWQTSLNGKDLLVAQYPLDVYLIHDKGVAFDKFDWDTISTDLKRSLYFQLLEGLTAIHRAGCMHRDITPMNLLVFPHEETPQATLCDFGKFCETSTDVETRLAGWQFLPPELQKDRKNPYNQTLDIWMLGLSLTYSWWPQTKGLRPREVNDYRTMQRTLCKDKTSDALGALIACMMAWDPRRRPSAVDALKQKTLQPCSAGTAQDTAPSAKRPHDVSDR